MPVCLLCPLSQINALMHAYTDCLYITIERRRVSIDKSSSRDKLSPFKDDSSNNQIGQDVEMDGESVAPKPLPRRPQPLPRTRRSIVHVPIKPVPAPRKAHPKPLVTLRKRSLQSRPSSEAGYVGLHVYTCTLICISCRVNKYHMYTMLYAIYHMYMLYAVCYML